MKTGRPKKEIKREQFEGLCAIQCTEEEICAVLDVGMNTLLRWCKREYGKTFGEVFAEKRKAGKASLRRSQFKLAERNAAMAIWLGKQFLGQTDSVQNMSVEIEDDGLLEALAKSQNRLTFDGDMIND